MKKLGINIKCEEEGWRKHILCDQDSPTGGFTIDLLEPFTYLCYDTCDFDVNLFALKKNYLNSIGVKIPLDFEWMDTKKNIREKKRLTIEELIEDCREKKMRPIKGNI
eukprot:GHVR01062063.1.p1 GENE.GHVR01062063.1~~GHVR01062063.1.p1  ORF type:complete len:108 (-),score=6.71 GHVR01062063.1:638-961(-)